MRIDRSVKPLFERLASIAKFGNTVTSSGPLDERSSSFPLSSLVHRDCHVSSCHAQSPGLACLKK